MPFFPKPSEGSWTEHFGLDKAPVSYEDSISPEHYELERDAIFRRTWLNVGRVEQLPRKGSYFTKEIDAARKVFPVVTVQNQFNLVTRGSEDVLEYCEKHGIGFIPWFPLAAGDLAKPGSLLDGIAKKHKASPAQIALAWILKRSPVMLPIPGNGKVRHRLL